MQSPLAMEDNRNQGMQANALIKYFLCRPSFVDRQRTPSAQTPPASGLPPTDKHSVGRIQTMHSTANSPSPLSNLKRPMTVIYRRVLRLQGC